MSSQLVSLMTTMFWVLVLLILIVESAVDYNRLVDWERRTLYCSPSENQVQPGQCYLTVGKDGTPKTAMCGREVHRNQTGFEELRFTCDIECDGADRDSVISKYPNWNRHCIRWFTYNTQLENGRWSIWRSGLCLMDEISLEVHCGFPKH